jgi:SpoVK/Ycf46/Vps4 family AAA+-type ATPase
MLKKINRRKQMDPKRIYNYNKFLSTLDHNSDLKPSTNLNPNPNPITNPTHDPFLSEKYRNLKTENDIKNEIDKIINTIENNFKINNYYSSNFTGQVPTDINIINNDDPNYYREIMNINHKFYNSYYNNYRLHEKLHKKEEVIVPPPVEIKETINIDVEINNISDILKLTEKYNLDPAIKYNINMQCLHEIKEPLEELNNMIGMKDLKSNIVDQILYFVQELHKSNLSNGDFMHTVIYGPPGTGKTEIAKIMGKIYSKIGVLSKGTFKKVTRSDLIAGYLGQTALKTRDVIKEAIGGVLFIDEAYALGNSEKRDSFSKECIDTLCEALSDNKENLMVIIAGYETELKDCFFNYNQGLDSRFTWRFKTDDYSAEDLYNIFLKKVKDIGWEMDENSNINTDWFKKNKDYLKFYGRDIETILAKTKIAHSRRVFCKPENEKRKLILKDLDKGFEIYLKNNDAKNRRDELEMKKYLYNTLYT